MKFGGGVDWLSSDNSCIDRPFGSGGNLGFYVVGFRRCNDFSSFPMEGAPACYYSRNSI
jgi:hypothetical protein